MIESPKQSWSDSLFDWAVIPPAQTLQIYTSYALFRVKKWASKYFYLNDPCGISKKRPLLTIRLNFVFNLFS
jgi:hypothetical protein